MSDLLTVTSITEEPGAYIRRHGTVVAEFDHLSQDSGNVSWVVEAGSRRLFVKTAGPAAPEPPGVVSAPYMNHDGRIRLLRNAIDVASSCRHPAMPRLLNVIESPSGPVLISEAAEGELVGVSKSRRNDPAAPYQRFARLRADIQLRAFDVLIDLHAALAAAGWVASDLYDGCLIFNFRSGELTVVDLDNYRRGPSANDVGRMFGSTRFMAPEEFELGAVIDERTTVFNLSRIIWHFGTRLTERAEDFCGPPELAAVVQHGCEASPTARPTSVAHFANAWRNVRGMPAG